jgi:hypothetical protein
MEYQRYILGNRACAEGLIFSSFAKDPSLFTVDDINRYRCRNIPMFVSVGVDFGGNGSNTTAVATLFSNNYKDVLPFADDLLNMSGGESDAQDFHEFFKQFLQRLILMDIARIGYIFGDNADPVMINEVRNVVKELKLANCRVIDCKKHTIKKRIDTKKVLMAKGHWKVYKDCKNVIGSTSTQVWDGRDGHEDERLDNGSVDIDTADAEEYSWSAFLEKLIKYCQ